MQPLSILYRDDRLVAVYKPAGLLMHRTRIADGDRFLMQQLRDQLGQWVYPVHRLDRPTAGVVVLGLDSEAARLLCQSFEKREVRKSYLAVVRGYAPGRAVIDYPLQEEPGREPQQAVTRFERLATVELPVAVGRYATARYSLLDVTPETGRLRQIRKHMKHIFHPIVGDTSHGDGRHNTLFRKRFGCHRLLLTACRLDLCHPFSGERLVIRAEPDAALQLVLQSLGWWEVVRKRLTAP